VLLRSILQLNAPNIFSPDGAAEIDDGVLDAFLKVPSYKHGVRSMEAIIDMSTIKGERRYTQSSLPSPRQLDLHVDGAEFMNLVTQKVWFGNALERIARAFHETYLRTMEETYRDRIEKNPQEKQRLQKKYPAWRPWDMMGEECKEASRNQVRGIPVLLKAINCGFLPVSGGSVQRIQLSESEIDTLAQREHHRWMEERAKSGWIYGKRRNNHKKIHPCLVPWEQLPDHEKEKDYEAVRAIPDILAKAGFEIYRISL
jgi:hypothetical protein